MPYNLEALTDDRFQELCQALLVAEYAGVQCFPVNQPDGGRDATVPDTAIVFQVKFSRNRLSASEARDWLLGHLTSEAKKVVSLAKKGATQYVIMTNVDGSAHPGTGLVDTVTKWIRENCGIAGQCLFRADIERRL